eukprot:SAG11_NODE_3491_length_2415_cov_2.138601_3_plen_160_part_00
MGRVFFISYTNDPERDPELSGETVDRADVTLTYGAISMRIACVCGCARVSIGACGRGYEGKAADDRACTLCCTSEGVISKLSAYALFLSGYPFGFERLPVRRPAIPACKPFCRASEHHADEPRRAAVSSFGSPGLTLHWIDFLKGYGTLCPWRKPKSES